LGIAEVYVMHISWEISITTNKGSVYAYSLERDREEIDEDDDDDSNEEAKVRFRGERLHFDEWRSWDDPLDVYVYDNEETYRDIEISKLDCELTRYTVFGHRIRVPKIDDNVEESKAINEELLPIHMICSLVQTVYK